MTRNGPLRNAHSNSLATAISMPGSAAAEVVLARTSEPQLVTVPILKTEMQAVRLEIQELRAEIYRAMLVQAGIIVGLTVTLIKVLP